MKLSEVCLEVLNEKDTKTLMNGVGKFCSKSDMEVNLSSDTVEMIIRIIHEDAKNTMGTILSINPLIISILSILISVFALVSELKENTYIIGLSIFDFLGVVFLIFALGKVNKNNKTSINCRNKQIAQLILKERKIN